MHVWHLLNYSITFGLSDYQSQAPHFFFRINIFKGCPQAKTCTIIIRGGAEQFMEETERSLHDAIMIVRRAIKNDSAVAGRFP